MHEYFMIAGFLKLFVPRMCTCNHVHMYTLDLSFMIKLVRFEEHVLEHIL